MGNCLRHQSSMQWGGDDWGSPAPDPFFTGDIEDGKENGSSTTTTNIRATSSTEVKIKITKKQLEELIGGVDMKRLSVEQVLAGLIKVGGGGFGSEHGCWRPNLQSIPE